MAEQNIAGLNAPFPKEILEQKEMGGRKFDFVPHSHVTARLNDCLGVGCWKFEIMQTEWVKELSTVLVCGRLHALIDGSWTFRDQWGGQIINKNRQGEIVELTNDFKGAASDALRKCASLYGVGEELYMNGHRAPKQEQIANNGGGSTNTNSNRPAPPTPKTPAPSGHTTQGERVIPTDKQLYDLATLADVNLKEALQKKWSKGVKDLTDEERLTVANGLLGGRIGKKAAQKLHIAASQAGWSEADAKAMLGCTDSLTEVKVIDYDRAMETVSQPKPAGD